jgi:hypothetical protein
LAATLIPPIGKGSMTEGSVMGIRQQSYPNAAKIVLRFGLICPKDS